MHRDVKSSNLIQSKKAVYGIVLIVRAAFEALVALAFRCSGVSISGSAFA